MLSAVADPNHTIEERSELNNESTLRTLMPDLTIANSLTRTMQPPNHAYPVILVENKGVVAATNAVIELRLDVITGTLLYSTSIPNLEPGALSCHHDDAEYWRLVGGNP